MTEVTIGGRNTCINNLRFADDKAALAEEEQELEVLNESLDNTFTKMEISVEKTKVMTNNASGIQKKIKLKNRRSERLQDSSTLDQLSKMKAQIQRFS